MKKKNNHLQKIGTFNCRGLVSSKAKQQMLADDFERYKLAILAIQETHMKGYGAINLISGTNNSYILYYSGHKTKSENGVGIIIPATKQAAFVPISDRICKITTKINNKQTLHLISAYAPTLINSEKNPDVREKFYSELDSVIKKHKSRHVTIIAGDFNAKTGSAREEKIYHDNIGKYGKGKTNNNGYHLLNFVKTHNLKLTNTYFKHKSTHRSTWEAPERTKGCIDKQSNSPRKTRYRNQIDYICINNNHRGITITNARSYGGMTTMSDHKLVITECIFKWPYNTRSKIKPQINYYNLQNETIRNEYQKEVINQLSKNTLPNNNQQRWTNIVEATTNAAMNTLGLKPKNKHHTNPEIKELSEKQKNLKLKLDNTIDNTTKTR